MLPVARTLRIYLSRLCLSFLSNSAAEQAGLDDHGDGHRAPGGHLGRMRPVLERLLLAVEVENVRPAK